MIWVICLMACGADETSRDLAPDMGITAVDAEMGTADTRLYPISEFLDPLTALPDGKNLNNCQIWVDRFQPRDRVASERLVLTFNELSKWVLEEVDVGLDRVADRRRSRVFEESGDLSALETDNDADGLPDQRITYQWLDGRLDFEEHDQNADGEVEGRRKFRYNSNGLLTSDEWVELPLGEVQQRTVYEYDENGLQTMARHSVGPDERLVWQIISVYDEFGRLSDWQEDNNGDGIYDYRILYTIDDVQRRVTERHDLSNDGAVDGITVTDFDERNRPILREVDQAGDGTINERIRFEYEGLRLLRRSIDRDLDGREDEITLFEYDEYGRLANKSSDIAVGDDVPPESWSVRYFCP